jgi:hypothetical protein
MRRTLGVLFVSTLLLALAPGLSRAQDEDCLALCDETQELCVDECSPDDDACAEICAEQADECRQDCEPEMPPD